MTLRKHLHSDSVPFKGNVQALKLKAKFEISVGIIFLKTLYLNDKLHLNDKLQKLNKVAYFYCQVAN